MKLAKDILGILPAIAVLAITLVAWSVPGIELQSSQEGQLFSRPVIEFLAFQDETQDEKQAEQSGQTGEAEEQDSPPANAEDQDPATEESEHSETESEQDSGADSDQESAENTARTNRVNRRDVIARDGNVLRGVFNEVTKPVGKSIVRVKSGSRTLALGAIVDENGFVLTKKSELRGDLSVELHDGSKHAAVVFGIHEPSDLALLKIEKTRLTPIVWNASEDSMLAGSWVITANPQGEVESLGVLSVGPRLIRGGHGFMGIQMDIAHRPGAKISEVTANSPAERAKLKAGDVIIRIEGQDIADSQGLRAVVSGKSPGDELTLTIQRGAATIDLRITLGSNLDAMNPEMQRANMQNNMGGRLSRRRFDFPLAFQHDSVLAPNQCGGPVLNINGEAIGINMARNGRVASLALPVSVIVPLIDQLKSGSLAPAVVNQSKIAEINRRLNEIEISLATDPDRTDVIQQELERLRELEKEAEAALQAAIRKAKEAATAAAKSEAELEITKERLKTARDEKEQLERQRERLVTGTNN
ncbi:MAG TPA: PDZ domain-containing protein [Pirellulaceae bacterium]|nr:PDZ domain-containing protein [Pirellulaceae bacterium]HMO93387.1 PDZ domain-containing protein [Pirellulaceae bacterium]HMP70447.1 PDZ domain-containing protein [Pirellulaceae bacterium]